MEVLNFPAEIECIIDTKLQFIKNLYELDSVGRKGSQLVIEGSTDAVQRANLLSPGLFLSLKKQLVQNVSKIIKLPKSVAVDLDDIRTIIDDGWDNVKVTMTNSIINVSGCAHDVKAAVEKIQHYIDLIKPPVIKRNRSSSDNSVTNPTTSSKKNYHSTHLCMFCNEEMSSRHFRSHCAHTCKSRNANLFSPEERNRMVDEYYFSKEKFLDYFNDVLTEKQRTSNSTSLMTVKKVVSSPSSLSEQQVVTSKGIGIDALLSDFDNYLNNPISGKSRFDASTRKGKISSLQRLVNKTGVFYLEDLLHKNSVMTLMAKIEDMDVKDSTRYDYALVVKEFLEFCSLEDHLDADLHTAILKGQARWEKARQNFQKGLVSYRATKKKMEIVEREMGKYPKVSDVALVEIYYRKKLVNISKKSYSELHLKMFLIWIAFHLSKTNALRPSSIGNMKINEFNNAFTRGSLRIVCVEGKPLVTKQFFHNLSNVPVSDCKNKDDNFGYVTIGQVEYNLIQQYKDIWRPLILKCATSKGKKIDEKYLFLTANGVKINKCIGTLVEKAWLHHRKKFSLTEKKFTLTRVRKAAQTKFEDELRRSDSTVRNVFNDGIGHK